MNRSRSRSISSVLAVALCCAPALAQGEKADNKRIVAEAREALQQGKYETAAASFKKAVELDPKDGVSWQLLGYSLHAMGKLDEALPVHKKAAEFESVGAVASYNVACVYALKGETEAALEWLQKSAEAGFDRPEHIATDSDMDSLRDNEQFKKIVKQIAGSAGPDRMQVFQIKNERKSSRVAWFGRNSSAGQLAIGYTPIKWQSKYDEMIDSDKLIGKKWRLGADFWTSLDTSVDLVFGETKVPAGYYYLTLVQPVAGKFVLGVHDAAMVKKQKLDGFVAHLLSDGIQVPLAHAATDDVADHLSIGIKVKQGSQDHGKFVIHFGGHALTSPVLMDIGGSTKSKKAAKKSKY